MGDYPRLNYIYITERLKHRLEEINNHPITTIIAPMGFGKTTAINWWVKREVRNHSNAIILRQTIDTNSITDFWSGFCRAFGNYPKLTENLQALGYPMDMGAVSVLSEILNDSLSANKSPLYLIIDDLHLLEEDRLTSILLFISRSLPYNVHFLLLSRNQIFNEEERMRLGNLLCEIEMEDLRLENQEVALYAKHCQLNVKMNELMALADLSEGWISMIYFNFKSYIQKGQWLSNSSDIFTLIEEVLLEPLPQEHKDFLILIGMADEFTIKQASYLWQKDNTKELLDSLSKNNAFITKNENGIYRYHHMLLQSTRQKFSERSNAYQRESYQRLGLWHLDQEEYISAYFAFAKANDCENLLITLEKDRSKSLNAEHSQMFFNWMGKCSEELLMAHPKALVIAMITMFSMNNIPELLRLKDLLH